MVYALNEWYNTYIYNSKMTKISKFLKNGQNLNPKLVLESVLDTDSKNGFGFLWWLQKVQFFYYQKVLFLALWGTLKMALSVLNTKNRNQFWNQWTKLITKLVSDFNFDHFWGKFKFWSFCELLMYVMYHSFSA